MKQLFFSLLLLVLITTETIAQNTFPASGYVGIGTVSPGAHLHIKTNNPQLFLDGDENSYYPSIRVKSITGDGWIDNYGLISNFHGMFLNCGFPTGRASIGVSNRGVVTFSQDSTMVPHTIIGAANQTGDHFRVVANLAANNTYLLEKSLFVIDKTGNVGIGISNPAEPLSVNGKIRAKEVRVDAGPWPDYVFRPDYNLKPLDSLRKEIQTLGHLPGMPDAKKVAQEGAELGMLVRELVEKNETLTLYLLQQHEQIKKLQKQVATLTAKKAKAKYR
ncbi:hypothetical protein LL912_03720 [Niabella sp. CC-SYL272]|uniref:hypothetical protein n=1 Tax=Niabella agricola TaxID=2891571 RepID=UPI001F214A8A|nr:hypothetical protein [Niabella agricola]MCF3107878.1 hypothetical protein [Niabella agricola]